MRGLGVGSRIAGVAVAAAVSLATAAPAMGATNLGAVISDVTADCGIGGSTLLQGVSPADTSYTLPAPGVITSYSIYAPGDSPKAKLKVGRFAGGMNFTIVGESSGGFQTLTPNAVNKFVTRVPGQAGDVIGLATSGGGLMAECLFTDSAPATFTARSVIGDLAVNDTGNFSTHAGRKLDIAATLEPDCDGDGFGDETQDADLSPCQPTKKKCKKGFRLKTVKKKGKPPRKKCVKKKKKRPSPKSTPEAASR